MPSLSSPNGKESARAKDAARHPRLTLSKTCFRRQKMVGRAWGKAFSEKEDCYGSYLQCH